MTDRISYDEGLRLFKYAPLEELQRQAHKIRMSIHPEPYVTFVLDSNPNYTNICDVDCTFCAFYRTKKAPDAYMKSPQEVMKHLDFARKAGLTTVLLQGGVHEGVTCDYLVELVRRAKTEYPEIHPHFFSAVEIWNAAKVSAMSVDEVLQALWNAGQRTLPGGGAEILSERIRLKVSPKKIGPDGWLNIHKKAHLIGFKTTATMMYGHIETPEDILDHLETLRTTQDETKGFSSFIPWSYKSNNTSLRRRVLKWAGPEAYYRVLALSRIYLDNFSHIGSSWFSEGKAVGIESLRYGADDFGGTIHEENVHKATMHINSTDLNGMLRMIRKAGFEPAQRDSFYKTIRTFEGIEHIALSKEGTVEEIERVVQQ